MVSIFSAAFLATIIRISTPILLPALGGLISDLGGVINIALEGQMLMAAFTGVAVSAYAPQWMPGLPTWGYALIGGLAGVLSALVLFFALMLVLVRIARRATDPFSSLMTFGILGLLFTHVFENVGMTVNVMPITGIPLPFFSYGGSFLLATAVEVGLVLRAAWDARLGGYVDF